MKPINFLVPKFSRYFKNFKNFNNLSTFRTLTNEYLKVLKLNGRVLDYGGGEFVNYKDQINNWKDIYEIEFESLNIDPETNPTHLVSVNDSSARLKDLDMVLSFNTFEHIYNLFEVFNEINKMLKHEGKFIFIVPFIIRVHGHPDDFLRGTPSYWHKLLKDNGFKGINIEAITWGPFSSAQSISGIPGPFKKIRKNIALLLDIIYFKFKLKGKKTIQCQQDDPICSAPLGYCISSIKR